MSEIRDNFNTQSKPHHTDQLLEQINDEQEYDSMSDSSN
jgi:hypothetical protein